MSKIIFGHSGLEGLLARWPAGEASPLCDGASGTSGTLSSGGPNPSSCSHPKP